MSDEPKSYEQALGAVPLPEGAEPAEVTISRLRDETITDAELAEWRRLEAAATPGPIGTRGSYLETPDEKNDFALVLADTTIIGEMWAVGAGQGGRRVPCDAKANAAFYAAARSAMPRLMDEVERLKAELALAEQHDNYRA